MQTENLTILLTDIVGFSKKLNTLSRVNSQRLLKAHDVLLKKHIKFFGGRIVKSIGDSFLVTFRSPTDATLCAMALQDAVWEYNQAASPSTSFELRVAINSGEVRVTHKDVFGDAVNIAARLESITPPNTIYLTESVYLSMHKTEVLLSLVGEEGFKGIAQAVSIYRVDSRPNDNQMPQAPFGGAHINSRPASKTKFSVGKFFVGIVAALLAAFVTWWIMLTTMTAPSQIKVEPLTVEYNKTNEEPGEVTEDLFTPLGEGLIDEVLTEEDKKQQQLKDIYLAIYQLLNEENYLQMMILIEESLIAHPEDAQLHAFKGHAHFYFEEYKESLNAYRKAFSIDSLIGDENLPAKDIVALLDVEREDANKLIAFYLSPAIIDLLSIRTGEEGLRGRYDAFYLLRDSGNQKRIDWVGLHIWDLRETQKCSQKKTAVLELKRLADPRALEALKESISVGLIQSFKHACFWKDAEEAIAIIETAQQENNQAPE